MPKNISRVLLLLWQYQLLWCCGAKSRLADAMNTQRVTVMGITRPGILSPSLTSSQHSSAGGLGCHPVRQDSSEAGKDQEPGDAALEIGKES